MEEIYERIRKDIEEALPTGYAGADLDKTDRRELLGIVFTIAEAECAFDNLPCMMDKESIIEQIKKEYAEEIWEHVYTSLISTAAEDVLSMLESDKYMEEE